MNTRYTRHETTPLFRVDAALAGELVRAFVGAKFSGDTRHVRRLEKVNAIEAAN